jgi:hypothetical protein
MSCVGQPVIHTMGAARRICENQMALNHEQAEC